MRTKSLLILSISLAGCTLHSGNPEEKAAEDVYAMIMANDPKACAADEAITTALGAASDDYEPAIARGVDKIQVDTISATNLDKDIHEISCSAKLHTLTLGSEDTAEHQFAFKLRPSLDQNGAYVAETQRDSQVVSAINWHILSWDAAHRAKTRDVAIADQPSPSPPATPAAEMSAAETGASYPAPTTEEDSAQSEKECVARVLQNVSAREASGRMTAGETWHDVTQFWRNTRTGETWYCAHGDYCYPTHVELAGRTVQAIKLLNCSVRGDGEPSGDGEVMYSVW